MANFHWIEGREVEIELDEEATVNLAALIARNDAARERAGLTEQEAAALNLEAARRALQARRERRRTNDKEEPDVRAGSD